MQAKYLLYKNKSARTTPCSEFGIPFAGLDRVLVARNNAKGTREVDKKWNALSFESGALIGDEQNERNCRHLLLLARKISMATFCSR